MVNLDLQKILAELLVVVKQVGEFQIVKQGKLKELSIHDKGLNQLVSEVDVESEKQLVNICKMLCPGAGFVTEENTEKESKNGLHWIIDPLDGTTNYLHGLNVYSISIALYINHDALLGIVHCPALNQTFTAIKNQGAFVNQKPLKVSAVSTLKQSLIATGFPYYTFEGMQNYLQLLEYLMKNTHGLRRMGSAAIDLAYTAAGMFEAFYETNLNAWDVAAGALIVEEAGGSVTEFNGNNNYIFGKNILASNTAIHQEITSAIAEFKVGV